jgi:hypothetical protein
MQVEHIMAFATETEPPGLEIRVNFGLFAGRAATPAELDDLAKRLVPEVDAISIVSEERHEVDRETEVVLHQVRIELAPERLPGEEADRESLTEKLVTLAEIWARACIADRHSDVGDL